MNRQYYAATLKEDKYAFDGKLHTKSAIEDVYVFDYYSQREQWLTEDENRVKLLSKIAKKHTPIEVTFEHYVIPYGYAGWVWMYDGKPEIGE